MEIPKAMLAERILSREGSEMADRADRELPDKVDTERDAELLRSLGLDPEELEGYFGGGSPAAG